MRQLLDIQKKLLPELTEKLKKRYTILHHVMLAGVVGRRSLALSLQMTERTLRSEVEFLKNQGLLQTEAIGMRITPFGQQLLNDMEPMIKDLFGLTDLEETIRSEFQVQKVIIVPGDSDQSEYTKKELGRAGARELSKVASHDDVIAVTGGSTMAEVAEIISGSSRLKGCTFVPARGGLGGEVELQANTIASKMAIQFGGSYRLLHVPDHLGKEAYQSLIQEPHIREILAVIRRAAIVIHGIGDALTMAKRRKVDEASIRLLQSEGALAEAFGYYFDREGIVVHKAPTVGLRLEDIQRTDCCVIAVAGGKSKGEAIASIMKFGHEDILITDEAAAKQLLKFV